MELVTYRDSSGRDHSSYEFRRQHRAEWTDLEKLCDRALARGLRSLDPTEVETLVRLYRRAIGALAYAREVVLDPPLVGYLEVLTVRAHLAMQCGPSPRSVYRGLWRRIPGAIWALRAEAGLALALVALGSLVGAILALYEPPWFFGVVDGSLELGPSPADKTAALRTLVAGPGPGVASLIGPWLWRLGLAGVLAASLGVAAGVPAAFLLFRSGLALGAITALFVDRGLTVEFALWWLPHGVAELVALVLCGAVGLSLGRAVVFAKAKPVAERLRHATQDAGVAVVAASLFAVAAVVSLGLAALCGPPSVVCGVTLALVHLVWIGRWLAVGRVRGAQC